MQRSSIIATVVAAGGILIAGSVASVAVINAASSSQPDSETIQLVAAGSTAAPSPEATVSTDAEQVAPAAELPTMEASKLPELPVVEQAAPIVAQPQAVAPQPPAVKPTPKPTKEQAAQTQRKPSPRPTKTPSASASASSQEPTPEVREMSGEKAVEVVLQATGGGTARSVEKTTHMNYQAWAVQLVRHDGSIVTGYVERSTGVIFDWVVNQEAPAASTPTAGTYSGGDDDSDDADDDHEDEDHEDEDDGDDD